jgi:hypothetical protein
MEGNESEHEELLHHANVHWLRRGTFLQTFRDLLIGAKEFLLSRGDEYAQLGAQDWLMDLAIQRFRSENLKQLIILSATFVSRTYLNYCLPS